MSTEVGLLFQVKNADDIQQYVRHATIRGGVLWGTDFPLDTKAVRYPLVVYLHNPSRAGTAEPGVQAYGVASRVVSGPAPTPPTSADLVPQHLRGAPHMTWFYFDQILPINPAVAHTEFYTLNGMRLESVSPNRPVVLGPPYPVKHPPA
ncbi:MAG TPA: hypothetical protein VGB42_11605 [Candidatus Thermoplasmatota archaeon]